MAVAERISTPARASVAYEVHAQTILDTMRERWCSVTTAARLSGVTPQAVNTWIREGIEEPEGRYGYFAAEVEKLRGEQIAEAEMHHRTHRLENPAATQWFLSKMAPETYSDDPKTVIVRPEPLPDATPDDVAKALGK